MKQFYTIDLFAGSGGLSEGFNQAGFETVAQIEMDRWACETLRTRQLYHALNGNHLGPLYHKYCRGEMSKDDIFSQYPAIKEAVNHKVIQAEFGKQTLKDVLSAIDASRKLHKVSHIHVVLGGPPCQAYSLAGRSRDPDRMTKDERHFLFEHYLKILEHLKPDFFVFENVPGLLTARSKGRETFQRILNDFANTSPAYEVAPSLDEYRKDPRKYILNSADFNIPQERKRIVLVGYKQKLDSEYLGIRDIFRDILHSAKKEKGCLTVNDAIGDLPRLKPGEGDDRWFGIYDKKRRLTEYQLKIKTGSEGVLNHRARTHMESDIERYKFFIEHHKNGNGAATLNDLSKERPDLMPDHKNITGFIDRFKVQWWDQPSSTIMAHICKDGHYYIHPAVDQCRSFTVREAARCQSFPDNYLFEGPRTEQFRQVGNAVPPNLAFVIARTISKQLEKIYGRRSD